MRKFITLCSVIGGLLFCQNTQAQGGIAVASFYHGYFHGKQTASGIRFNNYNEMHAAHKTLPFGTRLRVTNLANGRSIIVKIVDRGPYIRGRELDLSVAAAQKLGYVNNGTAKVFYEIIERNEIDAEQEAIDTSSFTTVALWNNIFDNYLTIKIGEVRNPTIAYSIARELTEQFGYPVMFQNFAMAGKTMYGLFVGRFREEDDAEKILSEVSKNYPESEVVMQGKIQ